MPSSTTTLDAWRAFLNAHAHVTRAIGRDLADAGLPDLGWYDLLWTLYRAPGRRLRVNELAREVVLSPDRDEPLRRPRREGRRTCGASPTRDDRRALQVALTDEGVALLRKMWPVYERGIEEHFAAHLGASPARLRRVLERVGESARASWARTRARSRRPRRRCPWAGSRGA